jgi:uncharacterized protein (DUF2141 family)
MTRRTARIFTTVRLTAAALASALVAISAPARTAACVQVEVQNLQPGKGSLMLAAYSDATSFRKVAEAQMMVEVKAETMQFQVCGLSGNAVALTLFQDLNGNGKLDANPFGIPNEPWGASGRVTPMSAPTWDSAQVPLSASLIVVKLTK